MFFKNQITDSDGQLRGWLRNLDHSRIESQSPNKVGGVCYFADGTSCKLRINNVIRAGLHYCQADNK
jgi:hypothetical protein